MEPQGYGEWRRRWEALKAHLTGRMPDPRVAEARRQQQAVTRGPHSRKVDPLKRAFVEARAAMAHGVDMELLTTVDCADDRAAVQWLTGEGA